MPLAKATVDVWGLGPADASLVPLRLLDAVASGRPVIARTARHPAFDALPTGVVTCDDIYEAAKLKFGAMDITRAEN